MSALRKLNPPTRDVEAVEELRRTIERLTAIVLVQGSEIAELRAANGLATNQAPGDIWLTIKEAAFRLKVSRNTVMNRIRTERVKYRKAGRHFLIDARTLV
jgi:excisionase family DNA binding protein